MQQRLRHDVAVDSETERAARAIAERAKQARKRIPRSVWIVAAIVSLVCVAGLAIALVTDWNTPSARAPVSHAGGGGGLGIGLMIGLAVGIALGSLLALRKR